MASRDDNEWWWFSKSRYRVYLLVKSDNLLQTIFDHLFWAKQKDGNLRGHFSFYFRDQNTGSCKMTVSILVLIKINDHLLQLYFLLTKWSCILKIILKAHCVFNLIPLMAFIFFISSFLAPTSSTNQLALRLPNQIKRETVLNLYSKHLKIVDKLDHCLLLVKDEAG